MALDNTRPKHNWILVLDADEWALETPMQVLMENPLNNPLGIGAYRA